MPNCKFTTKYIDESRKEVDFKCQEMPLVSGRCIFHDKDYLHHYLFSFREEHKRNVLNRLKRKVNHAISNNEPLICIGFQLPDFSLSDLSIISREFTMPVYFSGSQFFGNADFIGTKFQEAHFSVANFQGEAHFSVANFQGEANFYSVNFQGRVNFHYAEFHAVTKFDQAEFQRADYYKTIFKKMVDFTRARFYGEVDFIESEFADETIFQYIVFYSRDKTFFDVTDLSKASFLNTDLTGVRFSDKARWGGGGGKKAKEDRFKIVDERLLEKKIKEKEEEKDGHTTKDFNLGSIKAVYRNLRENYEYRMRYDEAGQFFIREMELKRKYREVVSKEEENSLEIKQNNRFRRNFSLTGLYYNLFVYGEDLKRPALILLLPLFILSTLYWGAIDPSSSSIKDGFARWFNATERTVFNMAQIERKDPPPLLVDTAIKTASLAILGTLLIPLRRKFERKFRH